MVTEARRKSETRIPVTINTREALKKLQRGGESYDELLRRMMISCRVTSGEIKPIPFDQLTSEDQLYVLNF